MIFNSNNLINFEKMFLFYSLDYHDYFMKNYKKIFEKDVPKLLPIEPAKQTIPAIKSKDLEEPKTQKIEKVTQNHDISYYTKRLRQNKELKTNPEEQKIDLLPELRKLLTKL